MALLRNLQKIRWAQVVVAMAASAVCVCVLPVLCERLTPALLTDSALLPVAGTRVGGSSAHLGAGGGLAARDPCASSTLGPSPVGEGAGVRAATPEQIGEVCEALGSAPKFYHENISTEIEAVYPLTKQMFGEAIHIGDVSRLTLFLEKMARGDPSHVLAIGGSFTAGIGCQESKVIEGKSCSWLARMMRWFRVAFPKLNVVLHDESRPAVPIGMILSGIGTWAPIMEKVADLIFIDTMANDGARASKGYYHGAQGIREFGSVGFEVLVRFLRAELPRAEIVVVQDGCPSCLKAEDMQTKVAKKYNLSIIDYGLLVRSHNVAPDGTHRLWPQFGWSKSDSDNKSSLLPWPNFKPQIFMLARNFCCPEQHAPWIVHQYLADLVTTAISGALQAACRASSQGAGARSAALGRAEETFWPKKTLARVTFCVHPLNMYSARVEFNAKANQCARSSSRYPRVVSGDWRLFEDRAGKPGWIAASPNSTMHFLVRFGGRGRGALSISWLTSYEGVSDAEVRIYREADAADASTWHKLRGGANKFSQAQTGWFGAPDYRDDTALVLSKWLNSERENESFILEVRTPVNMAKNSKVKILEAVSC